MPYESSVWRRLPFRLWLAAAVLAGPLAALSAAAVQTPSGLTARHRSGQTLLTFREVEPPITEAAPPAEQVRRLRQQMAAGAGPAIRYRIYRAAQPIRSIEGLTPLAEIPPLTGWNIDYYGDLRPEHIALRYVVEDGGQPIPPGTAVFAYNPPQAGAAYYAVTLVRDGEEQPVLGADNTLAQPLQETVGPGEPVLQRIEHPEEFNYVRDPVLHYFVRWESPPNCAAAGKPYDYLVAVPPQPASPAYVGIHLHCWGGSLNSGYGWWYGAEQGHLLLASNQVPYDWWTGYHERYFDGPPQRDSWAEGVVRPYTQRRLLSFLDWMTTRWEIDLAGTHAAGNSMGGSGSPMLAIRYPERIAWAVSWVGVHVPEKSPQFKSSYARVWGEPEWSVPFEDGTPVWDYFNDAWYLRRYPQKEIGLIAFSNGKNDGAIGWSQAVDFYRALQETRRPHVFVWGQSGHGQRAQLPRSLSDRTVAMRLRTDQSQPAFTHCSLDDDPGKGDPNDGAPAGQSNLYLDWDLDDIVDTRDQWEMTLRLVDAAPKDSCTVNLTPRRIQRFRTAPGTSVAWENRPLAAHSDAGGPIPATRPIQSGRTVADAYGLLTLEGIQVSKEGNRIQIFRLP